MIHASTQLLLVAIVSSSKTAAHEAGQVTGSEGQRDISAVIDERQSTNGVRGQQNIAISSRVDLNDAPRAAGATYKGPLLAVLGTRDPDSSLADVPLLIAGFS